MRGREDGGIFLCTSLSKIKSESLLSTRPCLKTLIIHPKNEIMPKNKILKAEAMPEFVDISGMDPPQINI